MGRIVQSDFDRRTAPSAFEARVQPQPNQDATAPAPESAEPELPHVNPDGSPVEPEQPQEPIRKRYVPVKGRVLADATGAICFSCKRPFADGEQGEYRQPDYPPQPYDGTWTCAACYVPPVLDGQREGRWLTSWSSAAPPE